MGKIFLVVPDAPMEEVAQLKTSRTLSSRGIRLGVLDNSKANADPTSVLATQTAITEINKLRDGLDPRDSAAIESLIAKYGPLARQLNKA